MTASAKVRRAPVLARLGLVGVGVAVGFASVDAAVGRLDRESDIQADEPSSVYDAELGWVNRPGFENWKTRINAQGMRSPEIPGDAPPDEVRILGVGPSNVYGAGRNGPAMWETWSAFLEEACNAELDGAWRVLNGGVTGYSIVQECRFAVRSLDTVEPDLVLVFVAPGRQELIDVLEGRRPVEVGGRLVPVSIAEDWPDPLVPLAARAHELLLHSSLYARHHAVEARSRDEHLRRFVLASAPLPDGHPTEALERTWRELEFLAGEAAARGVEVRCVVIPHPAQFGHARWKVYLKENQGRGAPPMDTPRSEPTDVLLETVEGLGIECWSLFPEMSRFDKGPDLLTADLTHWSEAGHEIVAGALLRHLRAEEGLAERLVTRRAANPRN